MVSITETVRTRKVSTRKTVKQGNRVETTVRVRERKEKTRRTVKGKKKPNGVILYRGPSLLDGSPIVVVATNLARRSKNEKTGDMVATWVLADGPDDPIAAVKTGGDTAICGDCPHRGTTCYVNVVQAPLSVWRKVKRGGYPTFHPPEHLHLFEGRFVRLGSYGDPAAVPTHVWSLITGVASGHTGYTHAWRNCDPRLARLCMASVETARQREDAVAAGWRTFRVRLADQPVEQGEFVCPASAEAGKRLSCVECRACSGTKPGGKNASPVIVFHGPDIAKNWRYRHYQRTMDQLHQQEEATRRVSLAVVKV